MKERVHQQGPGDGVAEAAASSAGQADPPLTTRQQEILDCVVEHTRNRGYPPSVREIGEAVGLTSTSTVHAHLATLQRLGYLRRDPTKPRAIEVRLERASGPEASLERRPVRHVPLVGDVAAGTGVIAAESFEEAYPVPADWTGSGPVFMLRVRGESMIEAGIMPGDFVVARQQTEASKGDLVVAGIPGEEATVKMFSRKGDRVVLLPANPAFEPIELDPTEVQIYGKVVSVLRKV